MNCKHNFKNTTCFSFVRSCLCVSEHIYTLLKTPADNNFNFS